MTRMYFTIAGVFAALTLPARPATRWKPREGRE